MLADADVEKLARRVGELFSTDAQLLAALPDGDVCQAIVRPNLSWPAVMRTVVDGYADRPALGWRTSARPSETPYFDTLTYRELWQRVTAVAAALTDAGVHPGDRIATLGFCGVDYTTIDMAIPLIGAVAVPLHAGAPLTQLQPMVDEVEPAVIACGAEYLHDGGALVRCCATTRHLVVFDYDADDAAQTSGIATARAQLPEVVVETLELVIARGRELPPPPERAADDDRLAVILYTSGSTGRPKGAMHPEGLAKAVWLVAANMLSERGFALPALTLNFMPMSHTGGRAMLYSTLGAGGTANFVGSSDLSTMLTDLAAVRPTQLNFVPRVWEMLHREYRRALRAHPERGDDEVLDHLRSNVLGGRYISALTGSAPISPELESWVRRLLDGPLIEGFGATESGPVTVNGTVQRPPVTDYKLVDVPDLGYYGTDRPHPRGELLIKSDTLFAGYYRRPDLTAEVFDADGFFRTGDVVAELAPDELRYLDRRNNVVKLSHGEFVALSRLEALYANCAPVQQIYVHGDSTQSYLLAVVVPTREALDEHGPAELKDVLLQALRDAAAAAELEPYEIPRDVLVEPEPFTVANNLLVGFGKPSRPNLAARYGDRLTGMYADHAAAYTRRMNDLREHAEDRPVVDTVCGLVGAVLAATSEAPPPEARFTEIGGDSLSAVTLANELEDAFGVDVPAAVLTNPAADLRSVAEFIDTRRVGAGGCTFAKVLGAGATEVHASDLRLDRFVAPSVLAGVAGLKPPVAVPLRVLLTGATGFLGRYLLLDWLRRLEGVGEVVCLVRARDDAAARARLDAVFDNGDPELLARYRALAADHLRVLAGDKAEPLLGLEPITWQQLADTVDLIVDAAAMVNHMLPCEQLFGPNVVGTAELIRLALTTRQKRYAFASTIGVGATVMPADFTEDADIRRVAAVRPLDDGYASGYATSKWAGEVLLREAHELCGLPITVFRCGMIMAAPGYRGQLNLPDLVTRLLFSVAATGLAPETFYVRGRDGQPPRAHFDGLPVDFVAEAIGTLGAEVVPDYRTFHVVNPHDDGIGLDQYVDRVAAAGYRIERIRDHGLWLDRFETALRNLPSRQRRASLLPLLDVFRWPHPPAAATTTSTERFRKALTDNEIGDGDIPHVDRAVIEKYLTDLELFGLLDADRRATEEMEK